MATIGTISIPVPIGFSLRDAVCSFGFFMLAPNRWMEEEGCFQRPLHCPRGVAAKRFASMIDAGSADDDGKLLAALVRLGVDEIGSVGVVIRQLGEGGELQVSLHQQEVEGGQEDRGPLHMERGVLERLVKAQVKRMLRLSEREVAVQQVFAVEYCRHKCGQQSGDLGPFMVAEESGDGGDSKGSDSCSVCGSLRFNRGRIFRSPNVWEDALRTITLCNISWPGTRRMNFLMCQAFGGQLPLPSQLAMMDTARLQQTCGVGYRAERIIALARSFLTERQPPPGPPPSLPRAGTKDDSQPPPPPKTPRARGSPPASTPPAIDPEWLECPHRTEAEVYQECLMWHGFGPYAAATLCQLLGHYGSIPSDTETVRHLYECHGINTRGGGSGSSKARGGNGSPDKAKLQAALDKIYGRYGDRKFLAYWTELWEFYLAKVGVKHMGELAEARHSDFTATTMAKLDATTITTTTTTKKGSSRTRVADTVTRKRIRTECT